MGLNIFQMNLGIKILIIMSPIVKLLGTTLFVASF